MNIKENVTELIGGTPLMRVKNYQEAEGIAEANILVKLEYLNPTGSAKDRAALEMILDAEEKGILKPGATIIEPTSGNTGIGLASVAAARGYKTLLTLPDTMSMERRALLNAYGAKLVLTDGKLGMSGAIARAKELQKEIPGSMIMGQFDNKANAQAHYKTTGPEIWKDTDGQVDVFVAGVGTGGTLTGVAKYLKEKNPKIEIIAVEPDTSAVLSGEPAGAHGLQGIGAGFVPTVLEVALMDRVMKISTEDAYRAGQQLAVKEGIMTGITSGAALHAATVLAKDPAYKGKVIVALLPDSGDRYLSTPMYAI